MDPVQVAGTLKPLRDVTVSAEGGGRVVEVLASLGDVVRAGDLLARLDSVVQRAQVDRAKAGLRQSEAVLALSKAGFKREETLQEGAATTPESHFRAGVDLESAEAGVESARAQLKLAERSLADTFIRAPFAGTIAVRSVELGALVGAGTPAFRLVDISRVVVSAGIPAREISRVSAGQAVEMTVPALGAEPSRGIVTHVGPEPDARTRAYPVEIEVDNAAGALRSGMVARVDIIVAERGAVLVPEDAVVDDEPPHVFVIEDERARRSNVVLGRLVAGRYEAKSGVRDGETLATFGKQHLSDGVRVSLYDLPATQAGDASSGEARQTPQ